MKISIAKSIAIAAFCALVAGVSGCGKIAESAAKEILEEGIPEHFQKSGFGDSLVVDKVDNVTMIRTGGTSEYKGFADVTISTKRHSLTKTIRYELKGTMDIFSGGDMLLEYKPADSEALALGELIMRAAFE